MKAKIFFRVNLARIPIAYSSFLKLTKYRWCEITGRDRYSCGGTKAGRLDHQRKGDFDPFTSDAAFLVDARGVLMNKRSCCPNIWDWPLILGCSSESLEAGKVVESLEAKTALELLRLSARSFFQMRFRFARLTYPKAIACW